MTAEELQQLREGLLHKRSTLAGDVESLSNSALNKEGSHLPLHLADNGTDTFDQDMSLGLVDSELDEIRSIDDALDKIADGTYGLCEGCSQPIPVARLQVLPHANHCVACQAAREEA
ncbi:MAG: TraR/DksA C4-type zinc finger protein [Planctomycetota bacterium]|jgi:DnaK suppressor protein|nr:TraR/DksA C4-type zinc finger protein [Planctomycetota bacterium]MDP6506424.1 TraR/DksA C4-type zinc finger protein [Planctomycetota bacterium]